jgi:hypothetical protein
MPNCEEISREKRVSCELSPESSVYDGGDIHHKTKSSVRWSNASRPLSLLMLLAFVICVGLSEHVSQSTGGINEPNAIYFIEGDNKRSAAEVSSSYVSTDAEEEEVSNNLYTNLPPAEQTLLVFLSESTEDSSVARKQVVDILVEKYMSPTSPDKDDLNAMIDSALEAMIFTKTDNQPVQVEGYPYLFVGSVGTSCEIVLWYILISTQYFLSCSSLTCTTWISPRRCNDRRQSSPTWNYSYHQRLFLCEMQHL